LTAVVHEPAAKGVPRSAYSTKFGSTPTAESHTAVTRPPAVIWMSLLQGEKPDTDDRDWKASKADAAAGLTADSTT
jgi:hypothetical protein